MTETGFQIECEPENNEFPNDVCFTVWNSAGRGIGNVMGRIEGEYLVILNLFVSYDDRNKGIGDQLLHRLREWGKERGAIRVWGNFRPGSTLPRDEVVSWFLKRGIRVDENDHLEGFVRW